MNSEQHFAALGAKLNARNPLETTLMAQLAVISSLPDDPKETRETLLSGHRMICLELGFDLKRISAGALYIVQHADELFAAATAAEVILKASSH